MDAGESSRAVGSTVSVPDAMSVGLTNQWRGAEVGTRSGGVCVPVDQGQFLVVDAGRGCKSPVSSAYSFRASVQW